MQKDWSSPSGSRWEPVPQASVGASSEVSLPLPERGATPRRHRRTAVALLLTLLGAGAVSAGAAYAQGDGAAASGPTGQPSSQVADHGDDVGRHPHGPHGASS